MKTNNILVALLIGMAGTAYSAEFFELQSLTASGLAQTDPVGVMTPVAPDRAGSMPRTGSIYGNFSIFPAELQQELLNAGFNGTVNEAVNVLYKRARPITREMLSRDSVWVGVHLTDRLQWDADPSAEAVETAGGGLYIALSPEEAGDKLGESYLGIFGKHAGITEMSPEKALKQIKGWPAGRASYFPWNGPGGEDATLNLFDGWTGGTYRARLLRGYMIVVFPGLKRADAYILTEKKLR